MMIQRSVSYAFGFLGALCFFGLVTPPHGWTDLVFAGLGVGTFILGVIQKVTFATPAN